MDSTNVKDERILVLRSKDEADKHVADGWELIKEQIVEMRSSKGEVSQATVAWIVGKILSPREFKVSEIKWLVKDGVRAKYTTMDFGGRLKVDVHGYNTELMKISVKVRSSPEEEFRDLSDQEWDNLEGKLGDRLLTAVRKVNEPGEEDIRNLLLQ